jgi:hypothetical protein
MGLRLGVGGDLEVEGAGGGVAGKEGIQRGDFGSTGLAGEVAEEAGDLFVGFHEIGLGNGGGSFFDAAAEVGVDAGKRFVDGVDFLIEVPGDFDAGEFVSVSESDDSAAARCECLDTEAEGAELGRMGVNFVAFGGELLENGFIEQQVLFFLLPKVIDGAVFSGDVKPAEEVLLVLIIPRALDGFETDVLKNVVCEGAIPGYGAEVAAEFGSSCAQDLGYGVGGHRYGLSLV